MHRLVAPLAVLLLLLAACTTIRGLDEKSRRFEASERRRVEGQVEQAVEKGAWAAAWNQAIDLGADRERMESILLAAIEDDAGIAEDMMDEIRARWGGLSPAGAERARLLSGAAWDERDYERAVEIELLVADDVPRYLRAWERYDQAPPKEAPDLLELILEAKAEAEEAED